uniref:Uncharacterized protein n=1 Tax=Anguilla anguilla TaxID=7936 RepID=A0A0E9USS1_ANGAN
MILPVYHMLIIYLLMKNAYICIFSPHIDTGGFERSATSCYLSLMSGTTSVMKNSVRKLPSDKPCNCWRECLRKWLLYFAIVRK